MKTVHWRDEAADSDHSPRTHVVIVAVTEYDEGLESHAAFAITSDALVKFWSSVAERRAAFAMDDQPVASVTEIVVSMQAGAASAPPMEAVLSAISGIEKKDRLIFHWVGHGFSFGGDYLLALPRHLSPGNENSREAFSLKRLTTYVGLKCKAGAQVFFVDCCSVRLPKGYLAELDRPMLPPDFERETAKRRDQYILVGSGSNRPAYSPAAGASMFTTALITTLDRLPRADDGVHVTSWTLRNAVAQCIQNQMVAADVDDLPGRDVLTNARSWMFGFVQELHPDRPEFREHDGIYLGRTTSPPGTAYFVWHLDARKMAGPNLVSEGAAGLQSVMYAKGSYGPTPLRAVIGQISRSDRIKISLHSNSDVKATQEWHGEGPVVRYELSEEALDG